MLVPEVILYNFLKAIIAVVNDDYNAATNKNESILGLFFETDDYENPIVINTFNFFNSAVGILIKNVDSVRKLTINLGYNLERLATPTIHILLPTENPGGFTGIGQGEGYSQEDFDPITGISSLTHTSTYNATYNLMITSDNSTEVLVIYNFLKGMFEMFYQQLELMGLRLSEQSGADIQFDSSFVPPNIFHRNFILNFKYESSYKKLFTGNTITKVEAAVCSNFYQDFVQHNLQQKDIPGVTRA